uniref:Uncharacterized protein n=1 Tax=Plectus sambesii TaxID=2011161 RepID=A0A914WNP1_9BILA
MLAECEMACESAKLERPPPHGADRAMNFKPEQSHRWRRTWKMLGGAQERADIDRLGLANCGGQEPRDWSGTEPTDRSARENCRKCSNQLRAALESVESPSLPHLPRDANQTLIIRTTKIGQRRAHADTDFERRQWHSTRQNEGHKSRRRRSSFQTASVLRTGWSKGRPIGTHGPRHKQNDISPGPTGRTPDSAARIDLLRFFLVVVAYTPSVST